MEEKRREQALLRESWAGKQKRLVWGVLVGDVLKPLQMKYLPMTRRAPPVRS